MFQYPTKFVRPTASYGYYAPFGVRTMHYGMDISNAQTDFTIYACNGGEVVFSAYDSGGGNMIIIHDKAAGELSRYAHLQSRAAQKGDTVARGQAIGIMGNTGRNTTAKHLHFETWLVPKDYSYNYADRTKYSVDPMCVCHLLEGQTWDANGKTAFKPLPYPEPQMQVESVTGVLKVQNSAVRLRLLPETKNHSYIVGGIGRGASVLGDFFSEREFVVTHICENDGYKWALISTRIGSFWVAEIKGSTELHLEGREVAETPLEPPKETGQSQLEIELQRLTARVKEDAALIEKLKSKLSAIAQIAKEA